MRDFIYNIKAFFDFTTTTNTLLGNDKLIVRLKNAGAGRTDLVSPISNLYPLTNAAMSSQLETLRVLETPSEDDITDDTKLLLSDNILPDGYMLEKIIGTETLGAEATVDLGSTAGTSNVFVNKVFAASSITVHDINFVNLTGSDLPLFINDDDVGSSWNSASLDIILILKRIK